MIQLKRALLFAFASLSLSTWVFPQISPDQLLFKAYKSRSQAFPLPDRLLKKIYRHHALKIIKGSQ